MKILMLVFNQRSRGTYWRAFHFARELAQLDHRVELLTTSPQSRYRFLEEEVEGVQVVETPDLLPGSLRSGWDAWNTFRRLAYLRGRSYDIVHAFETRPVNIYPALAASRLGGRLVFDWADWFGSGGSVEERPNKLEQALVRPLDTFFEENFRDRPDGTTVINSFLEKKVLAAGVSPSRICLLRNGSDPRRASRDVVALRQSLGIPAEVPILGFVGGTYLQDARFMAAALNKVHQRNPQVRLLLVGYFNRPIEEWLDHPEAVIRTGPISETTLYESLGACNLGWLPLTDSGANRGRWPYKLNDYMTVGRPVIATEVGDLGQVIRDHQLGEVTPPDAALFAETTLALLGDPDRSSAIGKAARAAAEGPYSWAQLTAELAAFYQRL